MPFSGQILQRINRSLRRTVRQARIPVEAANIFAFVLPVIAIYTAAVSWGFRGRLPPAAL